MPESDKIFTGVTKFARMADLDPKTVRAELEKGTIPGRRFGRIWKIYNWWIREQRDGIAPGKAA